MATNGISTYLRTAIASIAAGTLLTLAPCAASAKTPDGMTPSEETVCSGLTGAAFGLCNAYCEAQDCDVHPRPSCEQLRANFEKHTGSAIFPCDVTAACGDGRVDPGEECDPPGSACMNETICGRDCTCTAPECGNGEVEPGEQCDPPGSSCADGTACNDDCTCNAPKCGNGEVEPGEECDPPGSACADETTCSDDCTCNAPECGNGQVERGEECDPPGSPCQSGAPCNNMCQCSAPSCCECVSDVGVMCIVGPCPEECVLIANAVCGDDAICLSVP